MLKDIIKMALESLYANKLRTFLSILGIIIGVSTISLVIAIGLGAQKDIEDQFKTLSVTAIAINPVNTEGSQSKLSFDDVDIIKQESNNIESVTAYINGKLESSSSYNSISAGILGVTPDIFIVSNLNLASGEYLTDEHISSREKIAVIGSSLVDDLFEGNTDIIGEVITIARKKVKIIGVLEETGGSVGPISFDDNIYMPHTTALSILGTSGQTRMTALAIDIDSIDLAMSELTVILRDSHKLKDTMPDDFRLKDQGTKVTSAQDSANTMNLLLTMVATIVLIVSGIGIMNVMFAGVAERTREIGILKSIGAKRSDILNQFLIESIMLSIMGGVVGVLLGEILIPVVNAYTDMTTIRSTMGMIGAFSFSVVVGIFFGYYPAYKASKLDPVDALRS
ncbi:MAG: ABC transporter permease [Candidatus Gracilibacteria bacterium]